MPRSFIINFHGLGPPLRPLETGEEKFWLSVEAFEAILDYVAQARADSSVCVALTFDDGNATDYAIALPRLLARNLTARFFVVASRIDAPHFLSRAQIRQLRSAGMSIGSHGLDHGEWRVVSDKRLDREMRDAAALIADVVGDPITEVTIPYGSYDLRVLRRLREAGYRAVYTSDGGCCDVSAWLRPRTCITRDMTVNDIASMRKASGTLVASMVNQARLLKRRLVPGPPLMPESARVPNLDNPCQTTRRN